MSSSPDVDQLKSRTAPLEMTEEQFRSLGHDLVDRIASFLGSLRGRAVTPAESADKVRAALDAARTLPEQSEEADDLQTHSGSSIGVTTSVVLHHTASVWFGTKHKTWHPGHARETAADG
jgi:hypothetical protein